MISSQMKLQLQKQKDVQTGASVLPSTGETNVNTPSKLREIKAGLASQKTESQGLLGYFGVDHGLKEPEILKPFHKGVERTAQMIDTGIENVAKGSIGLVEKTAEKITGKKDFLSGIPGTPLSPTTLSQDFLNLGEGISDTAVALGMPFTTIGFNTASETDTIAGDVARGFAEGLTTVGSFVNKIPGLSHFRDTLSPEDQQRFDTFIGGGAFGMLAGTKVRDPKTGKLSMKTALKSSVNPKNIIDAFLDIGDAGPSRGTLIGEVMSAPGNIVRKFTNEKVPVQKSPVLDFLSSQIPSSETPLKQNFPTTDFLDKVKEPQTISTLKYDAPRPDLETQMAIKTEQAKAYSIQETAPRPEPSKGLRIGRKATIEDLPNGFDVNKPSHKYFDKLKDSLEAKLTKRVDHGDVVVLKDGTVGEVSTKTNGDLEINTPLFYSKKSVERSTKKIKNTDIYKTYGHSKVDDGVFRIDGKDTSKTADDFLTSFVETARERSKDLVSPINDLRTYKKSKLKTFQDMSKTELFDYIQRKTTELGSTPFSQKKNLKAILSDIKQKGKAYPITDTADAFSRYDLELAQSEMVSKLDIERTRESMGVFDIARHVIDDDMTFGQGLRLFSENQRKMWSSVFSGDTLFSINEQAKRISPELGRNLKIAESNKLNRVVRAMQPFKPLMEKWKNISKKDINTFKRDIYSNANKGVEVLTKDQRKALDGAYDLLNSYGIAPGYRKGYIPQKIADYDGLKAELGQLPLDLMTEINKIIEDAETKEGRKFTEEEKLAFTNELLQDNTISPLNDKSAYFSSAERRQITEFTNNISQYYYNPIDSIQLYFDQAFSSIELLESLGYKQGSAFATKGGDGATGAGTSIISWIDTKIASGELDPNTGKKIEDLLLARFKEPIGNSRFSRKVVPVYKDLLRLMSISNPISAITNLKDLAVSFYANGFFPTLKGIKKSITPKMFRTELDKIIKMEDLGLDVLDVDFRQESGVKWIRNLSDKAMGVSGFGVFDRFGKEAYLNSSYSKRERWAKEGDTLIDKFEGRNLETDLKNKYDMTPDEISTFKKDMQAGKLTDQVKYVLITDISGVQPVSKSAMPANASRTLEGKLFYTFKSYLVKRADFYRSEFFDTKITDVKGVAQRGARFIRFALVMTALGMGVDEIKDMLLNRKTSISDQAVSNLLELSGMSKYSRYQLKEGTSLGDWMRYNELKEKYINRGALFDKEFQSDKSVVDNVWGGISAGWSLFGVPATPIQTVVEEARAIAKPGTYQFWEDSYAVSRIPVVGKIYYWRAGAGAKKQERSEEMRTRTPGVTNRTLREIINPNVNVDGEELYYKKVARVVDGDTLDFKVSDFDRFFQQTRYETITGKTPAGIDYDDELGYYIRVRFQGADTAESVHRSLPVQFLGKEASDFAKKSLQGKDVLIKTDYLGDKRDKYGRLIGTVMTADDEGSILNKLRYTRNHQKYTDFNLQLIRNGLAKVTGAFPFSKKDFYYDVQKQAMMEGKGLWDTEAEKEYNIEHGITEEQRQTEYKYQKNPKAGTASYKKKKTPGFR